MYGLLPFSKFMSHADPDRCVENTTNRVTVFGKFISPYPLAGIFAMLKFLSYVPRNMWFVPVCMPAGLGDGMLEGINARVSNGSNI